MPTTLVSSSTALEIARTVGKTEGARMLGIEVSEFEEWIFDGVPPSAGGLVREVLKELKAKEHKSLSGQERESLPYRIPTKSDPWALVNPDADA